MNFLNVKTLHDNITAQVKIGLSKATSFLFKNDGSTISMIDDSSTVSELKVGANSKGVSIKRDNSSTISLCGTESGVNKLKVGGNGGFTITYSGDSVTFSSNNGSSPLTIKEPNKGGITGCAFYNCHQDKYSGGVRSITQNTATTVSLPVTTTNTNLPDPESFPDKTILMVIDGQWTPVSFYKLVEELKLELYDN